MKRLLILFSFFQCLSIYAGPPEVKPNYDVAVGQNVRINVKSAVEIGYVSSFTDDQAFFEELIPKTGERRFVFQSMKSGYYVIAFWTKGETSGTMTIITVGKPTVPDPGKPDPTLPPGTESVNYLIIIRKDTTGGADLNFTKTMQLSAWQTLNTKGIKFKDKTASEAKAMGFAVPLSLPVVYGLYDDGKKSKIITGPLPFPSDNDGVLKLVP